MKVLHITTVLFAVLFVGALGLNLMTAKATQSLSSQDASKALTNYLENKLGLQAKINSITDKGSVYEVSLTATKDNQSSDYIVFMSKDGKYMFLGAYDLTAQAQTQTPAGSAQTKLERPQVDLYIMSFCPYGVLAQTSMKPVVDLLGAKADFNIHFITSIDGNTVSSLHGDVEAREDARQACIMKKYGAKAYWDYAYSVASFYYTESDKCWQNQSTAGECVSSLYELIDTVKWIEFAERAGINADEITACATGAEGLDLLKADEALTSQYGIQGSPTIFVNGVPYSGDRSPEAFKQAVCTGFTTTPAECSQSLSTIQSSSSGGCQT